MSSVFQLLNLISHHSYLITHISLLISHVITSYSIHYTKLYENGVVLFCERLKKRDNDNKNINPDHVSDENLTLIIGINHKKNESK